MEPSEFAALIGIKKPFYSQYEIREELPSKHVYTLWKNLPDFPVPDDFFLYTSFTLEVNMRYHHLNQQKAAEMFDISSQSTMSGYMKENIPMYEKKEYFLKFKPFIVPYELSTSDDKKIQKEITELTAKGNFILAEKRKQNKIEAKALQFT